jgi:hypothetical protein
MGSPFVVPGILTGRDPLPDRMNADPFQETLTEAAGGDTGNVADCDVNQPPFVGVQGGQPLALPIPPDPIGNAPGHLHDFFFPTDPESLAVDVDPDGILKPPPGHPGEKELDSAQDLALGIDQIIPVRPEQIDPQPVVLVPDLEIQIELKTFEEIGDETFHHFLKTILRGRLIGRRLR